MTITTNFSKVWLQQRSLIFVTCTGGEEYVDLFAGGEKLARYTLNAAGKVTIDITDYMRAYPSTTAVTVISQSGTTSNVSTPFGGLISPDDLIIPANTRMPHWAIVPPTKIYAGVGCSIIFEVYPDIDGGGYEYTGYSGNVARQNELPNGKTSFAIVDEISGATITANYRVSELECGKRYAAVEWVSATGITRRHTFEIRCVKSDVQGAISLLTADSSYKVRKGRKNGFLLFIDGLTAYDYWYYADAMFSSSVKISFDGSTWREISIDSNSVTIPDGNAGEFNKLEMSVNYAKYDAASL